MSIIDRRDSLVLVQKSLSVVYIKVLNITSEHFKQLLHLDRFILFLRISSFSPVLWKLSSFYLLL